jgi:DNA-binding MarR family transcriptional regulator
VADTPNWLTDDEQAAWRSFVLARHLLEDSLDRQLLRDAGMPHAYFMILTVLVEADDRTVRMGDLAARLSFSRSRLTHAVASLERSGWVERRPDPADGRGQLASVTAAGVRAQHEAAVGHVAEVRRVLIDRLTPAQVRQLGAISDAVIAGFDGDAAPLHDRRA